MVGTSASAAETWNTCPRCIDIVLPSTPGSRSRDVSDGFLQYCLVSEHHSLPPSSLFARCLMECLRSQLIGMSSFYFCFPSLFYFRNSQPLNRNRRVLLCLPCNAAGSPKTLIGSVLQQWNDEVHGLPGGPPSGVSNCASTTESNRDSNVSTVSSFVLLPILWNIATSSWEGRAEGRKVRKVWQKKKGWCE